MGARYFHSTRLDSTNNFPESAVYSGTNLYCAICTICKEVSFYYYEGVHLIDAFLLARRFSVSHFAGVLQSFAAANAAQPV